MTRPRARRRLHPGMVVYVWYAGAVRQAELVRRGVFMLRNSWRAAIRTEWHYEYDYVPRRHIHLCREDCANAL